MLRHGIIIRARWYPRLGVDLRPNTPFFSVSHYPSTLVFNHASNIDRLADWWSVRLMNDTSPSPTLYVWSTNDIRSMALHCSFYYTYFIRYPFISGYVSNRKWGIVWARHIVYTPRASGFVWFYIWRSLSDCGKRLSAVVFAFFLQLVESAKGNTTLMVYILVRLFNVMVSKNVVTYWIGMIGRDLGWMVLACASPSRHKINKRATFFGRQRLRRFDCTREWLLGSIFAFHSIATHTVNWYGYNHSRVDSSM